MQEQTDSRPVAWCYLDHIGRQRTVSVYRLLRDPQEAGILAQLIVILLGRAGCQPMPRDRLEFPDDVLSRLSTHARTIAAASP